jgi:ribonucleotide reductase beta subunit family protein with ferritin-like domain
MHPDKTQLIEDDIMYGDETNNQTLFNQDKIQLIEDEMMFSEEANSQSNHCFKIQPIYNTNSSHVENKYDEFGEYIYQLHEEPLLNPEKARFTIFPIEYQDIWDMYKTQLSAFWKAEEIDFSKDYDDYVTLNDNEQHFVKMTLAFFAASDGIVNFNLRERFLKDVQIMEGQVAYGFQMMMESIHCVSGATNILTSDGYKIISECVNKKVAVWNGYEFSKTEVKFTGNSKLYRVELSNGMYLDCTPEHKWFIHGDDQSKTTHNIVFTKDLAIDNVIYKYDVPILNPKDPDNFENPYYRGFMCGTDKFLNKKFIVPINYSLKTKLSWLEGICDGNDNMDAIELVSYDNEFIQKIQLMLSTIGILSNIMVIWVEEFEYHVLYVSKNDISKLIQLGFNPKKMKLTLQNDIKANNNLIKITNIIKLDGVHKTYCFSEPLRHAGIFNGILTGQSEVYSKMLENIIKNHSEKELLFNAIKTVPTVKKMADWAFKWIDSSKSFAYRLVAFAIVEGVFFSGSFASIFWIKKYRSNGKLFLPGLIKSNEFIARDEGMHTDFACLMYSKLKYKLKQSTINAIMHEAVLISQEFLTDSIPCKFIGMNSESMNSYIEYVADRLMVSLGYNKIFNKQNPFNFMESIGLSGKTNFFESRATEYQQAMGERIFELSDDF